ncbi:MAG: Gfo/Idh/MocA family oxidoreductase [Dehalococcoidia bacterium]|jgi:predicted dehydrogenase|nr:Gfo/Idh/MocA family oxidoreductase [Dehalococcoidia bacterium]
MADGTIRIGLIGAGANTRLRHIPGFQAIDGVEVVAVCNRSRESGNSVADAFGLDHVTTVPQELLSDDSIDAISIGTWPYMHRQFTMRALEAGKHVLCEARMAMDASEARLMLEASQARPELVAQLVPAPFDFKSYATVQRLLGEGALGELREIHVTMLNAGALADAPLHWRERRDYSGTNTMMLGILSEVVHRWTGPTERVTADATTFVTSRVDGETGETHSIDVPDSIGVMARMASGARATYRVSAVAGGADPAGNGISLFGSEATLHWRMGDSMRFARHGDDFEPLDPDPGTAHEWQVEQDFIDSIRDGATVNLTNFEDGLLYMQFTEAVYRSWSEGRAVDLSEV